MKPAEKDLRLGALIRFSIAITVLNIFGHFYLGFEAAWAHPIAALATTYSMDLLFEYLAAKKNNFKPRFLGSFKNFVLFLLPAHISGMATSMLLFANKDLMPVVFASAVAMLSKVLFRVGEGRQSRHFLNPSNTGIAITLLAFAWVGIAPPYQFTENTYGMTDWILPMVFMCVGSFLNTKFTKRMPLILAWFGGFALQAVIRSMITDGSLAAMLNPMTGVAFLLFSFYMVSDPATTPSKFKNQIWFGLMVGLVYGVLVYNEIVFGQFFSLIIVCATRGLVLKYHLFEETNRSVQTVTNKIEKQEVMMESV
jgi:enediyne biosynthesis protein E5